jgi:hypothetical protein
MPMTRRTVRSLLAVAALGAAGCTTDSTTVSSVNEAADQAGAPLPSPTDAAVTVSQWIRSHADMGSRLAPRYRTLAEALPNVVYTHGDGSTTKESDLVVVGRITSVTKGRGFRIQGSDGPAGKAIAYDDPGAQWYTVHATVAVESAIGTDKPDTVTLAFPGPTPDQFDVMAAGLKALGRLVLFLEDDRPLIDYDQSLYAIAGDTLVATAADDGSLAMPFTSAGDGDRLLRATPRLDDLQSAGRVPRVIAMTGTNRFNEKRADGT